LNAPFFWRVLDASLRGDASDSERLYRTQESDATRRRRLGVQIVSARSRHCNCCSDWAFTDGNCGARKPTLSAALASGSLMVGCRLYPFWVLGLDSNQQPSG